jgi:hypothetical protein
MPNLREVQDTLQDWDRLTVAGEFSVLKSHTGDRGIQTSSTVKIRELPDRAQALIAELVGLFSCLRMEVYCTSAGAPDRVKIFRLVV